MKGLPQRSMKVEKNSSIPFPLRLHELLYEVETEGLQTIVSWQQTDNSFKVHESKLFTEQIMPRYFNQTKYKSFQRQLNIWGFRRIGHGPQKGGYVHAMFVRNKPQLYRYMKRQKVKGAPKPPTAAASSSLVLLTLDIPTAPKVAVPISSMASRGARTAECYSIKVPQQRGLPLVSSLESMVSYDQAVMTSPKIMPITTSDLQQDEDIDFIMLDECDRFVARNSFQHGGDNWKKKTTRPFIEDPIPTGTFEQTDGVPAFFDIDSVF